METVDRISSSVQGVKQSVYVQYSTFYVSGRLYGVDVARVQEVVRPMPLTPIPLAEKHVHGLINLRGQVVTAISLHELFGLSSSDPSHLMNVICKDDGVLVSFQVDEIGDVVEVKSEEFEAIPQTVPEKTRRFMTKVYRAGDQLLSILDVQKVFSVLNGV